jgi:glycerol-3-phosphate acyltransferase PlsY
MDLLGIVLIIICYFIGNLNFAYIFTKISLKEDIRDYGSGNAGTTNVLRVSGVKQAFIVFVLDAAKGALAIFLLTLYANANGLGEIYPLLAGLAVIIGHDWPIFLGFRGGKGVATTFGVVLALDFRIALITVAIFLAIVFISKMMSLGSVLGLISLAIVSMIFGSPIIMSLFVWVYALIGVFQHRGNIKRIINGNESKIGQKVKTKKDKDDSSE